MDQSGSRDQAEPDDAKVDDRVQRRQWFFRTRVGPDGRSLGGFANRAARTTQGAALQAAPPAAPGPHGALNWTPLGPSVVGFGQAAGRAPVSGRITALAVGPDALRLYAGAANGGVWFSADGGTTWAPLDDFVVSASTVPGVASNALSVGGLAVRFGQSAAVDDIFVGTGEPGASDGYFGIGIRHSSSGGAPGTWSLEAANLALSNFYRIVIDPDDSTRVFAATGKGLYIRPIGSDPPLWNQVVSPAFSHCDSPATDFIAAGRGSHRLYYKEAMT